MGAAVALRVCLDSILGDAFPLAPLFLAVLLAAWYGGLGPALFATALGAILAARILLYPRDSFAVEGLGNQAGFALYLLIGSGIAVLGGFMHRERAEADAAARQDDAARRHLAALVEGSEDAIVGKDLDGNIVSWNASAERLYGYTAAEIAGRPFAVLVPPDRAAEVELLSRRLRQGDRIVQFDTVRQRKDGSLVPVSLSYSPIQDGQGRLIGTAAITRDVTEEKKALSALRASESRFAAVIHNAPVVFFLKDADGVYLMVNPRYAQTAGRPVEDILGKTDHDLFPREVADEFRREDEAILASGGVKTFEESFTHHGRRLTFLTSKFPLLGATGEAIGVCGIATEISDRQAAADALRASEHRLRLSLEAGRMGVWEWDLRTNAVHWSEKVEDIHGLPRGTFEGTFDAFQRLVHPDDRPRVHAAIERALTGRSDFEIEFRSRRPDGTLNWIAGKGQVFLEDGRPARMVGVAMDVTARKREEINTRFLADASSVLAALTDEASSLQKVATLAVPHFADWCAVDMANPDGSPRRVAVAHVDPQKVRLAHEIHERWPPHADAPQGVPRILRTGASELVGDITDEMLVTAIPDAELLGIMRRLGLRSYMGVPLLVRGKALGAITFIAAESGRRYDATDLAAAEDLARRAAVAIENSQLYQAVHDAGRRKDEFLATLAHELRNPLAPIRNALYLLRTADTGGPTVTRALDMMDRQLHHLTRLVDDLLDVSRVMRGKIDLRPEPVDLAAIATRAVETAQPLIDARRHTLTVVGPEQPLRVQADPVRLTEVVSNLLTNAAKYTEPGGAIRLAVTDGDGQAEIRVSDTGVGIAPDVLPRVFDLFFQADTSAAGTQGGLGIGLTLVKSLVELHGGTVEARSAGPGHGSEFVVRVPIFMGEASEMNAQGEPGTSANLRPAGHARKVLVVDDHPDAADSLAMLLRLEGHQVRVARNGPAALEAAQAEVPDVVLLDLGMPGMDGFEVARRLRRGPASHVLIAALTGWGQEEDRRRTREAGFDHHLVKPADPNDLRQLLARVNPA
jgi:PAS domain S-box-containing protein